MVSIETGRLLPTQLGVGGALEISLDDISKRVKGRMSSSLVMACLSRFVCGAVHGVSMVVWKEGPVAEKITAHARCVCRAILQVCFPWGDDLLAGIRHVRLRKT